MKKKRDWRFLAGCIVSAAVFGVVVGVHSVLCAIKTAALFSQLYFTTVNHIEKDCRNRQIWFRLQSIRCPAAMD